MIHRLLDRPRLTGLFCAAAAVGLGLAYLAAAGAPMLYLLVNLAALALGAGVWLGVGPRAGARPGANGLAAAALALALIATAMFGLAVDGASRWVHVGSLSVQVSFVVLPAIVLLYARSADAIGTAAIAIASLALALQPDRAMAGVLAASMGAVALAKPGPLPALAFLAAAAGFGAAMLQPDALPAVPFVDRILYTAYDLHAAAGLAVTAGCLLLLAPAFAGARRTVRERPALLAFGACWAAAVVAAALGNYPTPLVGYGGSAVIGYLLSAALLPVSIRGDAKQRSAAATPAGARGSGTGSAELAILPQPRG